MITTSERPRHDDLPLCSVADGLTLAEWRSTQEGSLPRLMTALSGMMICIGLGSSAESTFVLFGALACILWAVLELLLPGLRGCRLNYRARRREYSLVGIPYPKHEQAGVDRAWDTARLPWRSAVNTCRYRQKHDPLREWHLVPADQLDPSLEASPAGVSVPSGRGGSASLSVGRDAVISVTKTSARDPETEARSGGPRA